MCWIMRYIGRMEWYVIMLHLHTTSCYQGHIFKQLSQIKCMSCKISTKNCVSSEDTDAVKKGLCDPKYKYFCICMPFRETVPLFVNNEGCSIARLFCKQRQNCRHLQLFSGKRWWTLLHVKGVQTLSMQCKLACCRATLHHGENSLKIFYIFCYWAFWHFMNARNYLVFSERAKLSIKTDWFIRRRILFSLRNTEETTLVLPL